MFWLSVALMVLGSQALAAFVLHKKMRAVVIDDMAKDIKEANIKLEAIKVEYHKLVERVNSLSTKASFQK